MAAPLLSMASTMRDGEECVETAGGSPGCPELAAQAEQVRRATGSGFQGWTHEGGEVSVVEVVGVGAVGEGDDTDVVHAAQDVVDSPRCGAASWVAIEEEHDTGYTGEQSALLR